ncbi:MAG TPA: hypothetical protein VHZ24_07485 [Pirellulales bacterium]|jgi:hypothetical protein|nr:hypothetical protein [Pirellulales bacterium]
MGFKKMPQHKSSQAATVQKPAGCIAALRNTLERRKKADLVELLLELARADRRVLWQLAAQCDVVAAPQELAAATRQAIADATDFDERDANRNFDYDGDAYCEVKRNLSSLIDARQLPLAMQLSLELMKAGSLQVEVSDEGLMTADIEDCLRVVIKALQKSDMPADEVLACARRCGIATGWDSSPKSNSTPCGTNSPHANHALLFPARSLSCSD